MRQNNKKEHYTNYKFLIGIIIGIIAVRGSVYATTLIESKNVTYSNTKSALTATDVQNAIDELDKKTDLRKRDRFVEVYTYNQESGASNYCVTGKEETCQKTDCHKTKTANSCPAGTIVKYKVNDTSVINFHIMFDEGETMTMQSQKNTIHNTVWYEKNDNSKGPLTILPILENATKGWSNVNDQTYTLGTTSLSGKGVETGCDKDLNCTTNTYTLPERTAKARLITLQEAASFGFNGGEKGCPVWMYNYLKASTDYEGTENDTSGEFGYWSSSASNYSGLAWCVDFDGGGSGHAVYDYSVNRASIGARAVVEVSK